MALSISLQVSTWHSLNLLIVTPTGEKSSLGELFSASGTKPLLLNFGSYTCPPYAVKIPLVVGIATPYIQVTAMQLRLALV